MKFVANINTPGYLPEGDPVVFDTAAEAWSYLAEERQRAEEEMEDDGGDGNDDSTYWRLRELAEEDSSDEGYVTGGTPGYEGNHDLGKAYSVSLVSDEDAAEIESLLS